MIGSNAINGDLRSVQKSGLRRGGGVAKIIAESKKNVSIQRFTADNQGAYSFLRVLWNDSTCPLP